MTKLKITKDLGYSILFAICILVTYLDVYELTFLIWTIVFFITIKRKYSVTIFQLILPFIAIIVIASFSTLFFKNDFYAIIRDITYLVKPILGLLLGYQLCRSANMKVIETIIYVGFIIAIIHLLIIVKSIYIYKILNIHQLRLYSGYFSDFEVYAFILVLFHKKFDIDFKKTFYYILILTIGLSSFLYLSRANFLQGIILYLVLKGYFSFNRRTILVLLSLFTISAVGYSLIYNMNLSRNGKGLEALFYKIKNAPTEAFKTKVDKEDWADFNDNYRAYENIITYKQVKNEGALAVVIGKGLGSKVNLGQKLYTNDGSVLTQISMLHNAFMTVYLKAGIIGVFFLFYFLRLLLKRKKSDDLYINNLSLLVFATAIYLIIDNWVLLGLYLKTESKAIVIGILLAFIEYNKNKKQEIE
jgi:hypothetical protein